ncbi:glycoside hydrolase family 88 protein [Salinarchaeum laminariae]|uniref:glycoside hydrolase family 88 protein n=1 Tax=Salinarchaeum laminariae TaxID=869888 RepID=UPI0020BE03DB|nr:glycoside hydrolase family 88 protein [Salinarchaeum laminariae]
MDLDSRETIFDLTETTFEPDEFDDGRSFALDRVSDNLDSFHDQFPSADTGADLTYDAWPAEDWTPSFWTGLCWLAYDITGDDVYRDVASGHLDQYESRITGELEVDDDSFAGNTQGVLTHDLGFLYSLSAVAQYRRTGDERARQIALRAADYLADRYHDTAGIIQAWGDHTDPADEHYGETIVDCMLNLPLLFWASEETGYDRYAAIATNHAEQTAAHLVRDDGSVHHAFEFDVETGEPVGHRPNHGAEYGDDSCWARGQAWAIYGFALAYRYTGNADFLDTARHATAYYVDNLATDFVPRWDFDAPETHMRDTSAGAIAACGLTELASHLPVADPERHECEQLALATLASLGDNYATDGEDSNALLTESWYASSDEVDQHENATIWGDYFYLEGLARATTDWEPYW